MALKVGRVQGLDRALCRNGHKRRSGQLAVWRAQRPGARFAVDGVQAKRRRGHGLDCGTAGGGMQRGVEGDRSNANLLDWPDLRRQPPVRFERKTWNLGFWLCHCSMSRIRVDARNSTSEYASLRFDLSNSPLTSLALLLPKALLNPIDSASTKSVPTHISRASYLALCKSAMAFSENVGGEVLLLRVVLDSLYELARYRLERTWCLSNGST